MSSQQSDPTSPEPPAAPSSQSGPPSESGQSSPPPTSSRTADKPDKAADPLRSSRTSGIWFAVVALIVVMILLAIFILQNTQTAEVSYFAWTGSAPISAMLLIAAAGGALLVAMAGALRILQLRRRVKRERKSH